MSSALLFASNATYALLALIASISLFVHLLTRRGAGLLAPMGKYVLTGASVLCLMIAVERGFYAIVHFLVIASRPESEAVLRAHRYIFLTPSRLISSMALMPLIAPLTYYIFKTKWPYAIVLIPLIAFAIGVVAAQQVATFWVFVDIKSTIGSLFN